MSISFLHTPIACRLAVFLAQGQSSDDDGGLLLIALCAAVCPELPLPAAAQKLNANSLLALLMGILQIVSKCHPSPDCETVPTTQPLL